MSVSVSIQSKLHSTLAHFQSLRKQKATPFSQFYRMISDLHHLELAFQATYTDVTSLAMFHNIRSQLAFHTTRIQTVQHLSQHFTRRAKSFCPNPGQSREQGLQHESPISIGMESMQTNHHHLHCQSVIYDNSSHEYSDVRM